MANYCTEVRVTVTVSSIAEKSFPALAQALFDKGWKIQRGFGTARNSIHITDAFWKQACFSEDADIRKATFEAAMQERMSEVQQVIDAVSPKALDSYGVRMHANTVPA